MENSLINNKLNTDEPLNIRHYFTILLNYKWRILLFSIMMTAIAVLIVLSIPSQYTAKASLLIESKQAKAVSIEDVYGIDTKSQEYYLTQIEILKSDRIAEEVIARLNLNSNPEFDPTVEKKPMFGLNIDIFEQFPVLKAFKKEEVPASIEAAAYRNSRLVLAKFKRGLEIRPIRKTQLVSILYTSKDPKLSANIANEIGRVFMDSHIEAKLEVELKANTWLNNRMEELRGKLRTSEAQMQDFLKTEGLVDIKGVESLASQELAELTSQLNKTRDRRVAAETLFLVAQSYSRKDSDLSSLASIPEISNHPIIRDVKLAEVQAERKVSDLSKRYGPKHPSLKSAQAELTSVKRNLNSELRQLLNGINNELQAAKQAEKSLHRELKKRKLEFQTLTVKNAKYSELKREVQTNSELFDLFLSRQKETSASSDFNATIARFTDFANPPLSPSKPNRKLIVVLVFIASFGFACVMAFMADAVNDTFVDIKQVEKQLSLSILGVIPEIKVKGQLKLKSYFDSKFRDLTEAIRTIRTGYLLANTNKEAHVVMVTSSLPEEGKTTSSINLAFSLSQMEKTLLIDCDLRKPSIAHRFDVPGSQPGVTNLLTRTHSYKDCIYTDEESNLDILTAGVLTNNPLELISSEEFKLLINKLKTVYTRIVIDTPPCLAVSDSFMLTQYVDSTILVINAAHTRTKVVRDVVGKLAQQGVRIDGVILNKLNVKKAAHYGGYHQYQSYYGSENS
ncbi:MULTISPECIES: exopolysaccharide regulatory tyrosine autokinase VpsO [Vibrio]|uniref:non-specific protein-tyrosine kinase n=1 Tax=Vibrio cortegadensis TaxID=1328770 RepID=A0ABV4M6F4_9VIBR|nr:MULTISPECIES: exopolysaccharide regulatory tyrosine autokinase VpsO [Vibrio]MDN3697948.1 exopolysaccharide regulatory tyrosine autokinase VpsO [Vibrio cortegadensis]NOH84992.1 polysaccharide biosynthesis tyrosine autokinase [Vibrio sp. 03-59-1]RBW63667.1 chain-length determining protein [Vibrionales bacterium C3R12]TKF22559.1 polysaccharide biosynthesis tyrosine autokinase [Vibrio genomosp. F6]